MLKKILKLFLLALLITGILVAVCNIWIVRQTKNQIYSDISLIPGNKVGLVLGTSKYFLNGTGNLFFRYRIEAAAELFKANKIKHIIVSGDNHVLGYNEAADMKKALLEKGIRSEEHTSELQSLRHL